MTNDKKNILLVDDDLIDRLAFERYARKTVFPYGYMLAGSIREALQILETHEFDALVLDYILGDGTAFDLISKAGRAAIIVVTGLGDEKVAVAAMKAGAADYLVKDTLGGYLTTLPLTIDRAIRNKENERELALYRENLEYLVAERTMELAAEVSQHQKAAKALRDSQRNWERTFNAINDIIIIVDSDRIIIRANRAAASILNLAPRDLVGKIYHDFFRNDKEDSVESPVEKCLNEEQGCAVELQYGKGRIHLVSCSPVFTQKGVMDAIVLVGKDITEQKQLEAQLVQAQKMEAIGVLAGGISHDFNNILTGILGYSQLAMRQTEPDSFIYNALENINKAGLRARDLVKQILAFSRKSSETKQLLLVQLIIKECLTLIRATIPRTVTIRHDIDPDCGVIMANPVQIHQVLMNLCANASHAMEKTGGELFISLRQAILTKEQEKRLNLPAGRYLLLAVQDTGAGIDPEILSRIFEPFFTTKGLGKGTGMGLSVVHGIIKECGGNITVESKKGIGSLFHIFLPLSKSNMQENATETETPPLQTGSGRILFVDDEEQIRFFAKIMLGELGYQVTMAVDGMEAWRFFTAKPDGFDLVITDKSMPKLTGLDLAGKIRSVRTDLPIILCSGDQTGMTPAMLGTVGIQKFLTKPFVIGDMAQAVHEALAEVQPPADSNST
ncbi:MAG: response regulator [Proteobacteria bacterium]|nr:response regulator [Pseudomonadota bacterium]